MDLDDEELKVTRMMNGADRNSRVKVKKDIEVNEYVRTKDGKIDKVINSNFYMSIYVECEKGLYLIENIVKHSKQLIDLIEIGDYVNGREVKHIAMFEGFPDYPKLIFVDETHLIPDDTCENEDIKTILTKEIYMDNCYKVGGEDE